MPLSDTQIRNLKAGERAAKFSDGGGLHLLVTVNGSKLWRLAYRFGGKQKTLALGAYPHVSLAEARSKRDGAKGLLAAGADPSQHAKEEKARTRAAGENTFGAVADEFLKKVTREGRAEITIAKKRWLLDTVRADMGKRPIAEITAAEILTVLRKVEAKGHFETARRMRETVSQVFRYAIATARAESDPTFGLRGALTSPTVTHRPAVTDRKAFGGLLRAVWSYGGNHKTRAALQLMAILYPRPGELRNAEWAEFDLDKATWTIPAARTKMRREHKKPLPRQAIEILTGLRDMSEKGGLVFASPSSPQRPISENTLNGALRRMGFAKGEATAHGFRASASTLLNESHVWAPDAIEAELGHAVAGAVRRAYNRAAHWDERIRMAAWWADEVDTIRTSG